MRDKDIRKIKSIPMKEINHALAALGINLTELNNAMQRFERTHPAFASNHTARFETIKYNLYFDLVYTKVPDIQI